MTDKLHCMYYHFRHGGIDYYVKPESLSKENLLDFKQYFTKSNDSDGDIFCDDETIQTYKSKSLGELQKYVCFFPIEWDASLYEGCSDKDCDECMTPYNSECKHLPQEMVKRNRDISHFSTIAKIMKQADVKKDSGFSEKELWHFHPWYFLNHLEKFNQSFNPYYGETFGEGEYEVTVRNNPGFAPVWEHRHYVEIT